MGFRLLSKGEIAYNSVESLMPIEQVSSPAGGSAAAIGMEFQHRVAACLAVRILADTNAGPLWDWPSESTIEFIRCETEQPVDDIMVGSSDGRLAFIQVKRSILQERNGESPFAKTITQFVRQALRPPVHDNRQLRPWDRTLDYRNDRLVLAVGPTSSSTVTSTLASVLRKTRSLRQGDSFEEAAHSLAEKKTLHITCDHIRAAWLAYSGTAPSDDDVRKLLSATYVLVFDVEQGGRDEREATDTIRTAILIRPEEAQAAWATLINECSSLASRRGGSDRPQLQKSLAGVGISIRAARSYQNDIQRLKDYSLDTINALANFASISVSDEKIAIQRPSTFELRAAAELGSLLVTGEPGLGKSGALHDLAAALRADRHDVLVVAADRVGSSSAAALKSELGLEHSLSDVIENWHGDGSAFLITDALDAARSEFGIRMFKELIEAVLQRKGRWRVVASIRKFDLRYNPGLRSLFSAQPLLQSQDPEFPGTRVFLVPRLGDDEISQLKSQSEPIAQLIDAIDRGPNQEMRQLIRIPFNLRLLGELIGEGLTLEEITPIKTQLELLDRYWQERVIRADRRGDSREALLRQAVIKMVENRALRIPRVDLVLDTASGPILDDLLSSHLLQEHQISLSRPDRYTLTFPHHLLFDYAVARLLFRGDRARLVQQIAADPERIVAFRPSLALHFRYEWELDKVKRSGFWELVFRLAESPNIPLIGKIIGPTEAVELFQRTQDFESLLERVGEEQRQTTVADTAKNSVLYLIRALAARRLPSERLVGPRAQPWCQLAAMLSQYVEALAHPLGQLLDLLFSHAQDLTFEQSRLVNLGARRLLDHVWSDERNYHPALVRDGLVGVCRTFRVDVQQSSKALRAILRSEHVRQYGHHEFFYLAQEIPKLLALDPELVGELYKTAFREFNDSETTTMLGGPSRIMSLVSNVRQDWQGNFYQLAGVYPDFLNSAPMTAVRALLAVVETWTAREHATPSGSIEEQSFLFRGLQCTIRTDYCAIWDSGSRAGFDYPIQMLNTFKAYIEGLEPHDAPLIGDLLTLVANTNIYAVVWRRLLWSGVERPQTLGIELREMLWQIPILTSRDTTEAAGALIAAVFARLSNEDRIRIEQSILAIPPNRLRDGTEAHLTRDRLLGCIPSELIVTSQADETRKRLEATGGPPPNEPLFKIGEASFKEFTAAEYLREQGVPVDEPVNRRILDLVAPIKRFCEQYLNQAPPDEQLVTLHPQMLQLAEAIRTADRDGAHAEQKEYALGYLVQACSRIVTRQNLKKGEASVEFARQVLLDVTANAATEDSLQTSDSFDRSPSWGSPQSFVDAARGLIFLAASPPFSEESIFKAIERLSRNAAPAVRLQIAGNLHLLERTGPENMWRLTASISKDEPSRAVLQAYAISISNLAGKYPERVVPLIERMYDGVTSGTGYEAVRLACFNTFLGLYLWRGFPACERRIISVVDAPWDYSETASHLAHTIRYELIRGPTSPSDPQQDAVRKRAFLIINRLLQSSTTELNRLCEEYKDSPNSIPQEIQARIKVIRQCVDAIAHQVYFASGAFDLQQNQPKEVPDREQRERFLKEASPTFDQLAASRLTSVAYNLAATLESLMEFDPPAVFLRLRNVIVDAQSDGLQFESLAVDVVVRTVKRFLAEYRAVLRDRSDCRVALVDILDVFVRVGWPAAQELTYSLEEIFR